MWIKSQFNHNLNWNFSLGWFNRLSLDDTSTRQYLKAPTFEYKKGISPSCAFWGLRDECMTCRIPWLCSCTVCPRCEHGCAFCDHSNWQNVYHNRQTHIEKVSRLQRKRKIVFNCTIQWSAEIQTSGYRITPITECIKVLFFSTRLDHFGYKNIYIKCFSLVQILGDLKHLGSECNLSVWIPNQFGFQMFTLYQNIISSKKVKKNNRKCDNFYKF